MGLVNLPIGATRTGVNAWSDVHGEDQAIVDQVNGNLDNTNLKAAANIAGTQLASGAALANLAAASVTDAKLASPNNSVYKTVLSTVGYMTGATVAASPYFLTAAGNSQATGSSGASSATVLPLMFDFTASDYSVASLTTKFRVKMQASVGSTSPSTVTFNGGLYPITLSSDNYALGTVVTGSTTGTSPTPALATNTISRYASSDFAASALLSDPGTYVLGVVIGSITVPTHIAVSMQLQVRNV